ncbi:MAG: efflux RND transporter periplasmic adaptor subunit [Coriobacteriales bacterium]|jgi:multidrug efflux pump subunit AcrA (membrane-fusion protein)|nr:efflux RND transporter periplasmic adaptor subunit [Coriobacteriales bacterium]
MTAARKRRRWPIVLFVAVVAIAAAAWFVWQQVAAPGAGAATTSADIISVEATTGSITTTVVGTGNIEESLLEVAAPVGLTYEDLLVEVGDVVEVGTPLARIDTNSVSDALATANDELDALEDSLDALSDNAMTTSYVLSPTYATVKQLHIEAGSSAAEVAAEHGALVVLELPSGAELNIKNTTGTVSELYVSEGSVVYEGSWLFALETPEVTQTAENLEAQRSAKLAELEQLSTLLYEPTVYSDAAGTISSVFIREGESFTAEDGVAAQIVSPEKVQITVTVDELDIATVKAEQTATVEIEALPGINCAGTVTEVTDSASISGGIASYSATVTFDKPEGCLTGMSATATIVKERKDEVLTIPLAAVQEYGTAVYVYTALDETGALSGETQIETGLSNGTSVEVTSGLSAGMMVYYRQQTSSDANASFTANRSMMMGVAPTTQMNGGAPVVGEQR